MSLLAAVLLASAFPPFNLWPLAWVGLVPFFLALNNASGLKQRLLQGGLFGLVFFGVNLFWITSLTRFVGAWAILGWLCLVVVQALFLLILAAGFTWRWFRSPLLIAAGWVLLEWLRSVGPFGITAGGLAYSQWQVLPIIQSAAIFSGYGISFLIVWFNAALAVFIKEKKIFGLVVVSLVILASILYGLIKLQQPSPVLPKMALIQANIDQLEKMKPELAERIYLTHEAMSRQAAREKPEVIIWPETAVITYLLQEPRFSGRLISLAQELRCWLVLGTPYYQGNKIYNSIAVISPAGRVVARYDKERLVAFGEYLPWRPLLFPLLKPTGYFDADFDANPRPQQLRIKNQLVAAAICFESTFPELIKKRVKPDTAYILTLTNDAWFGASAAAAQHLAADVLRAVENRKYFIQVGNTGISAIIDPAGKIIKRSRLNQRAILFKI